MFLNRFVFLVIIMSSLFASTLVLADNDDGTYLDPEYKNLIHPIPQGFQKTFRDPKDKDEDITRSNTEALIAKQSPVKSQGARGTCSIFSATAVLESMLIIKKGAAPDIDLSEEWLQYVIGRNQTDEGSSSWGNFSAITKYGETLESAYPYIPHSWKALSDDGARQRCGKVPRDLLKSCLVAHRDPRLLDTPQNILLDAQSPFYDADFYKARTSAEDFAATYFKDPDTNFLMFSVDEVKSLLRRGIPVTVDLRFYYGSWNHREATDIGLERDMVAWNKGIVSYPEKGSIDHDKSPTLPAGHSVVLVGYDDNVEIKFDAAMSDGTTKSFTRKGVYYFKNSWGTDKLGAKFELNGKKYPGYAMISQDYAQDYGSFYRLPLK